MADLPESQAVGAVLATRFNESFAKKAEALVPQLNDWIEAPLEVISFHPDPEAYFKCRAVHRCSIAELSAKSLGKGDEVILDFGSHRVGYFSFYVGADGINIDAPARLKLTFGEIPYDVLEELHPCNSWISSSWIPEEILHVDWVPTNMSMPRRYSFRYVRLQVLDTSPKFKIFLTNIQVRAVSSVHPATKIPPLPSFYGKVLEQVDEISTLTLRDCMQTVFEDGPRRDRRLWIGDLRLEALTNYCTFKNYDLVKRCLYLFAALPREDGSLPASLFEKPAITAASDYIVDYDVLYGSVVYDYVLESGELAIASELWPTIIASTKMAITHITPSGVYSSSISSGWSFIDWEDTLDKDAAMHGLLIFSLKAINSLARLLSIEPPFSVLVADMSTAALSFFDREKGVFISGPARQVSWASQAWMALADFLPPATTKQALLTSMQDPTATKPLTPYLYHYVAEALARVGAEAECLEILSSYWGGMAAAGADTFWECYDPEDSRRSPYGDCHNNSYCHAWSCTPSYLLRKVLRPWTKEQGDRKRQSGLS
jgi:alpha-L-rhamnosidase